MYSKPVCLKLDSMEAFVFSYPIDFGGTFEVKNISLRGMPDFLMASEQGPSFRYTLAESIY